MGAISLVLFHGSLIPRTLTCVLSRTGKIIFFSIKSSPSPLCPARFLVSRPKLHPLSPESHFTKFKDLLLDL